MNVMIVCKYFYCNLLFILIIFWPHSMLLGFYIFLGSSYSFWPFLFCVSFVVVELLLHQIVKSEQ